MISCPTCNTEHSESSAYCSACGTELRAGLAATVARQPDDDPPGGGSVRKSRPGSSHHGRFLPGTSVAGRYRIVSLVGKGGMGEVYRADDLKLGHTVALKFLPRELSSDPKMLEYFHSEVRLTRQISHPNECRVYDIGEAVGQHFLSMEYIDGEDLRVLLRRIGRVPKDKGIQIAQQLCAGLAAAHDLGVLHRDLKPANIMLDGRGHVRITDFGLAKLAEECVEGEVAGTPAYMAPEQLIRGEATVQSDLFALGLILYELFTGRPVHTTGSIPDLIQKHENTTPSPPSSVVEDMDPSVERLILRCLETQPKDRPKSVHVVAAGLPGGNPLAAALAAGETPSPELIASAGETGSLSLRAGGSLFLAVCVLLLAIPFAADWMDVLKMGRYREAKPAVLEQNARDWIRNFGIETQEVDSVYGYSMGGIRGDALEFWYRQSPFPLNVDPPNPQARSAFWAVTPVNPLPIYPGMVGLRLDAAVRFDSGEQLLELLVIPEDDSPTVTSETEPNWTELIAATGLDPGRLEPVSESEWPTEWRPPLYADAVSVWAERESIDKDDILLASRDGRLVYFRRSADASGSLMQMLVTTGPREYRIWNHLILNLMLIVTLGFSGILALSNLHSRRCDTRGATRLALYFFAVEFAIWVAAVHHVTDPIRELVIARQFFVHSMGIAFRLWLYYVALEPYARRFWPDLLISWSRLLKGRLHDPLVGRDLQIGCFAGVLLVLFTSWPATILHRIDANTFTSGRIAVAEVLESHQSSLTFSFFLLAFLLILRVVLRNTWLAGIVFTIAYVLFAIRRDSIWELYLSNAVWASLLVCLYVRYGLVSVVAGWFTVLVLLRFPFTADFSAWYAHGGMLALASVLLVTGYGFYISTLAGRRVPTPEL